MNKNKCYQCEKVKPLIKTYRTTYRGTDIQQTSISLECEDCIGLEVNE